MLEALRGLGYSPTTALADIIDNSISAGATRVDLEFRWKGSQSLVAVCDDGRGMTDAQLEQALRLGDIDPLAIREKRDLGRFGMGLKTASFSQCRRLTVATRHGSELSCLRWDLAQLATSDDDGWYLHDGPDPSSTYDPIARLGDRPGTVVLWEDMDRLTPPGTREQDFLDVMDRVERHLATVFHRFLSPPRPRLLLFLNGRAVKPSDPFLSSHPSTMSLPEERFSDGAGDVVARAWILPHRDRLTADEYERGAGPDGWTAHQGFYVYRNDRLLVEGSWLGLGRRGRVWGKEAPFRLARIALDIPNVSDAEWKIDIRKSRATPPQVVRTRLTRLAEDAREKARRIFARRGRPERRSNAGSVEETWMSEKTARGARYRVNRDHPCVVETLALAGPQAAVIEAMLRVLEETVPVQQIWLDTAESGDTPENHFDKAAAATVLAVLEPLYRNLVLRRGCTPAEARARLLLTRPFDEHAGLVAALPDDPNHLVDGANNVSE